MLTSLNTPILFLVFNRPLYTQQVFESIRRAQPKQLFIAADGPREHNETDIENCAAVKAVVANVDWDCEVKKLYREENLGCGLAPSSAISWFFEHVDQGIILEDDCLPSASFFLFCEEMLERYKYDTRINSVSGTNPLNLWEREGNSYFFSKEGGIWGWGTWKRAWDAYDFQATKWHDPLIKKLFFNQFNNYDQRAAYTYALDKVISGEKISFWDYQWVFCRIINSQFGIVPSHNLISNIGFGNDATHTFDASSKLSNLFAETISFPLVHPKAVMIDKEFDQIVNIEYFGNTSKKFSFYRKVINKILFLCQKFKSFVLAKF